MLTNILIFKFMVIWLAIYSVSGTILEGFGHFFIDLGYIYSNLGTQIKNWYTSVSVKSINSL